MSGLCKVLAGVFALLSLAGSECRLAGAAAQSGTLPLYMQQLQEFAARDEEPEPEAEIRIFTYTVQRGDSLSSIARHFGTDVDTLVRLNNIANRNLIITGQVIEVLTVSGSVHAVREGETLRDIAALYGVEPESILAANARPEGRLLTRGERLIIPGGTPPPRPSLAAEGSAEPAPAAGPAPVFAWPVQGSLTSRYGWRQGRFHYGIDLGAPLGTPITAAAAGRVVFAAYRGSYGLLIELDHGGGWLTRYAHAGSTAVAHGEEVEARQLLGHVGVTGNTTGPHLHFEIVRGGERIDPLSLLP